MSVEGLPCCSRALGGARASVIWVTGPSGAMVTARFSAQAHRARGLGGRGRVGIRLPGPSSVPSGPVGPGMVGSKGVPRTHGSEVSAHSGPSSPYRAFPSSSAPAYWERQCQGSHPHRWQALRPHHVT